jgi:phosphatidylethanolamine-binding protein (PEBP) family uncharacterized protein
MMRGQRIAGCGVAAGLWLTALMTPAAAFTVKFSWSGIPACSNQSPAFTIIGAPTGTSALSFTLHDQDAPDFVHGGSTVPYAGSGAVLDGAITYTGPCPPPGTRHHYVWTVEALDGDGKVLATTRAAKVFP